MHVHRAVACGVNAVQAQASVLHASGTGDKRQAEADQGALAARADVAGVELLPVAGVVRRGGPDVSVGDGAEGAPLDGDRCAVAAGIVVAVGVGVLVGVRVALGVGVGVELAVDVAVGTVPVGVSVIVGVRVRVGVRVGVEVAVGGVPVAVAVGVVVPPSHPASLAAIHQKAFPLRRQLNPWEWAQSPGRSAQSSGCTAHQV